MLTLGLFLRPCFPCWRLPVLCTSVSPVPSPSYSVVKPLTQRLLHSFIVLARLPKFAHRLRRAKKWRRKRQGLEHQHEDTEKSQRNRIYSVKLNIAKVKAPAFRALMRYVYSDVLEFAVEGVTHLFFRTKKIHQNE
jgi:hypothetical protein